VLIDNDLGLLDKLPGKPKRDQHKFRLTNYPDKQ
jgi:hypothetical protein